MKMIKINRVDAVNDIMYNYYDEVYINADKIICVEDATFNVDNIFKEHSLYFYFKEINPNEKFANIIVQFPDGVRSFISVESKDTIYSMIND